MKARRAASDPSSIIFTKWFKFDEDINGVSPYKIKIVSGLFEGKSTGTPIGLVIKNTDKREKDYDDIKDKFRPAHADYTYFKKYGLRDYRGGGRSSARETAMRVAAGAIARLILGSKIDIQGAVIQIGTKKINLYALPILGTEQLTKGRYMKLLIWLLFGNYQLFL